MKREKFTIENPALAQEWDYEKNGDLRPEDFTGGANKYVWWRCNLGHSWQMKISERSRGRGCPYCKGCKVLIGFNDLSTTQPQLVDEWDYTKNNGLRPEQFSYGSQKKVWWRCKYGHSWQTSIAHRSCGRGCPYCKGRKVLVGFNDLSTTQPQLIDEWDYTKNDGLYPEQFTSGSQKKVWWKCKCGHSWKAIIGDRKGHGCPYCNRTNIFIPGKNDLLTVNPKLAKEWDYERNAPLRPETVAGNANRKAWWSCEKGHSWLALISSRNYGGYGCPYCANKKVLKGFNDLLSIDPLLCLQWDYEKNTPLGPDKYTMNSHKKVWWKCNRGHSWETQISVRRRGSACPYCTGKFVIPGETDFKTICPEIAAEWDYEKNGSLRPENVACQSIISAWWICKHGHSYKATISNRYYGKGCPYCNGKRPIFGETDLATAHPELLLEWDYEKNGSKMPEDYTCCSNIQVWWKCKNGHSWRTQITDRNSGNGCPYCSGRIPMRTRLVK